MLEENITPAEPLNEVPREYTMRAFLSAAECNAQQEMSLPMLTQRIIDVATAHANIIGCGYARLIQDNCAWVLSRLSIEITRFPAINEYYSLTTWVEAVNRHYSERNMRICDGNGETIGYARTVWVAIDIATRRPANLLPLMQSVRTKDEPCPIGKFPRFAPITEPDKVDFYTFRYSDIDFNRHVNSTRYVELMLNEWGVDFFDKNRVERFDIAYQAETRFGEEVEVRRRAEDGCQDCEIVRDGNVCTRARIKFTPRGE